LGKEGAVKILETISCKFCGSNDFGVQVVEFKNKTKHQQAFCRSCDKHLNWLQQVMIEDKVFSKAIMAYFDKELPIYQDIYLPMRSQCQSPIESAFFDGLYAYCLSGGLGFSREIVVSPQFNILGSRQYRVDFLIQSEGKKIIVECDGHEFHEKTKEQAASDKKRDRDLQNLGFVVYRFTGSEVLRDPAACVVEVMMGLGKAPYQHAPANTPDPKGAA